jgi:HSP20 family protein
MNRLFDRFFDCPGSGGADRRWIPAMDLVEKDELRADLPGMSEDDVALPEGIDPNDVQANFGNGVLEVRIPKPNESKPTRVQIGTGGAAPAPPTLGRCGRTRPGSALMSSPVTATPARA